MSADLPQFISVGKGDSARKIAVRHDERGAPGVLWLSGFKSDMLGTKAEVLCEWAEKQGLTCTRMDYSGHGESGGEFVDGTISLWLEEAVAVFKQFCKGPTIVVGSSMGGWMALLLAKALHEASDTIEGTLSGMVLIAPAPDFTEELMWKHEFTDEIKQEIMEKGRFERPSEYEDSPYIITRDLIEDGRTNLLLGAPIITNCKTIILQGQKDDAVPWQHALRIVEGMAHDDVVLTLVKDGDHRLSRPEDLDRMIAAVAELAGR
ncbi:Alpha/beta hydrolase family protein [Pseudovibrio sp. Ad46]|uniref:alpha/beta hydrolase n=1 Tax=unclassified Pseudovibrio TaxID=2627060 RepID=UPI0007AE4EA6|nr:MULTISPECIES: alpha/beta hydrolase [unclassified Pseudovibrio]KZK93799.1 Alpha/beta hydrolase family protein [Pseudovibrio sp. Ad46]KZL23721.1 Alpha/beta hydrolase family protein [Pseudovibrio sp. WM33]